MPRRKVERTLQRDEPAWWSREGEDAADLDEPDAVWARIPTQPMAPPVLRWGLHKDSRNNGYCLSERCNCAVFGL